MKATLEYNLPEEISDLNDAINGLTYKVALWNMMQHFHYKIEKCNLPDAEVKVYEDIQSVFSEFIEGLSLE